MLMIKAVDMVEPGDPPIEALWCLVPFNFVNVDKLLEEIRDQGRLGMEINSFLGAPVENGDRDHSLIVKVRLSPGWRRRLL